MPLERGRKTQYVVILSRKSHASGQILTQNVPNFTVRHSENDEKKGKNKLFQPIFARFWCGRQESAFSGAPRSDVINVVLCQRVCRSPSLVGQSILLSQNGSHPQFLSIYPYHTKQKSTREGCSFVWCGRQELKTYDDAKKALIFKAFLLLNANVDAKIFQENEGVTGLVLCA